MLMLHGRKISCGRISGLFAGRRRLPGHYEFRAQDPNRCKRPRSAGIVTGLALCRSDLSCHKAFAPTQLAVGFAAESSPVARLVSGIGSPHGPANARQLVGQCDGRLVVSDALLQLHPPLLKPTQARGVDPVQLLLPSTWRRHLTAESSAAISSRDRSTASSLSCRVSISRSTACSATRRWPGIWMR